MEILLNDVEARRLRNGSTLSTLVLRLHSFMQLPNAAPGRPDVGLMGPAFGSRLYVYCVTFVTPDVALPPALEVMVTSVGCVTPVKMIV